MIVGYPRFKITAILDNDALDALVMLQQKIDGENLFIGAIDKAMMVLNEQEDEYQRCTAAIRDLLCLRSALIKLSNAADDPAGVIDFADYTDDTPEETRIDFILSEDEPEESEEAEAGEETETQPDKESEK